MDTSTEPHAPPAAGPPQEPADDEDAAWRAPGEGRRDLLLLLGLFAAYVLAATHTLQGADSSEWVSILRHGGTPHAPGYPVYAWLLRLFGWVPLPFDAPFRAALLSALLTAAAMLVFARALEERNGHPLTTRIAAVALGLSFPVWRMAGVAEVTSLLLLNAALLLWAAHYVENEPLLRPWHGALLGGLLGLGVAHHHTLVAALPMVLFHVIRGHHPAGWKAWTLAVTAGVAAGTTVVAGAFLLLRVMPSDAAALHMQTLEDVPAVVRSVLREEYGGFRSSRKSGGFSLMGSWGAVRELLMAFHIMVPMGLAALQRKRGWAAFSGFILSGPVLLGTFTLVAPDGTVGLAAEALRERFEALPLMFFAVMVHDALASLAHQLPRLKRTVFIRAQLGLLLLAMGVAACAAAYRAAWHTEDAVQFALENAVPYAPDDAVVVLVGDARQNGTGLPPISNTRLSPSTISGR